MTERTLCCSIVIWLLLVSCVKVPEHHSTVGKYTELHDINTECPQEKNIVPTYSTAMPQQVDELNSQGFVLLNWNSYKGSNKGWLEDLERLRKR